MRIISGMKITYFPLWDIYSTGLLPVGFFLPHPVRSSYFTATYVKETDTAVVFEMKTLCAAKLPQKNLERKILAETDNAESFASWQKRNR
ncbi:MAG: hypothetical protein HYT16_01375 [DPANN group archaeon]|nr:hypothetical protein [DPANN group archaeon]